LPAIAGFSNPAVLVPLLAEVFLSAWRLPGAAMGRAASCPHK
jgi:hypothetical protein